MNQSLYERQVIDLNNDILESFLHVARTKSVSVASELLFISQPTVTHRIQTLEKELGERLFVNKNRQMILTDAGQAFLPYAINILDNWNRGVEQLRYGSDKIEGSLTVSMFHHASMLYGEKLVSFMETYPKIEIVFKTLITEDAVQQLLDRQIQFALIRSFRHPRLAFHKIKAGNFLLTVHPDHPLAKRKTVTADDLRGEQLIVVYNGNVDRRVVDQFCEKYGTLVGNTKVTNSFDITKQLIAKNRAIAYLPQYSIQAELDNGSIAGIPIELHKQPPLYDIDLVWLKENANLALYRLFITFFTGKSL